MLVLILWHPVSMKKIFLISVGFLSLALGIVGIVLPILPTTPFLLLSAACFLRSSHSLHSRLTNHRILGNYIKSFQHYRAISVRAKFSSILTLWLTISFSAFFVVPFVWLKIALFLIAAGVTIYILNLRTLTNAMKSSLKKTKKDK